MKKEILIMKYFIVVLMAMALTTGTANADLSEADYVSMTTKMERLHAAREVHAEFQGFITDIKARRARILEYKTTLGIADTVIPVGYIDTATDFYQFLGTVQGVAETDYKVFLTGDDGVEE